MTTGEVKAKQAEMPIISLKSDLKKQAEFTVETTEIEVSTGEKLASNCKVKERFSRLKKSLRKKSVSI